MAQDGPLDALAARMVLPAKSGVYLTRNELIALARVSDGSLRVSERRRMLADVLKSPQSPAELVALLERLSEFCRLHAEEYAALGREFPAMQPLMRPWEKAARASIEHLGEICEELANAG